MDSEQRTAQDPKIATEALQASPDASRPVDATPTLAEAVDGLESGSVYGLRWKGRCALPGCAIIVKKEGNVKHARFCSVAHKNEYWHLAAQIGDRALSSLNSGKSHPEQILDLLKSRANHWVDRPHQRLPHVLWGTMVSRLRKRGYNIECRRLWREDVMSNEYQYRLVL